MKIKPASIEYHNNCDCFKVSIENGKVYSVNVNWIAESFSLDNSYKIFNAVTSEDTGLMWNNGTFTSNLNGDVWICAFNDYGISYTIDFTEVVDTDYVKSMLDSIKTYIDSKDSSVKAYADSLIEQLMQTSDLSAKLELLNQINDILDGDSATAGFQAWQESLNTLTSLNASLKSVVDNVGRLEDYTDDIDDAIYSNSMKINSVKNDIIDLQNLIDSSKTDVLTMFKTKASTIFAV
jgi:hypothetical protein